MLVKEYKYRNLIKGGIIVMNWIVAQSTERPTPQDTTSSKVYNYVRRNIHEVSITNEKDEITMYEYEELKIKKDAWDIYKELEKAQADIDYLNMITEDL
jgi:hypothetical protein